VRVIEVGQALAGPMAGVLLADMGTDVTSYMTS
jgi:crotonobetainyl-CoA:carnitine CoA-transferase CaiB-like acyl-CoA transferase